MIKAIIFDLDGTLVNSLEDLADSTNFALKQKDFPTHETEKFKYFVGDGIRKLIERALPENQRDEETIGEIFDIFMNHYRSHYMDKTVPYAGISNLLKKLASLGIKTAVVSNKIQEMAERVVEKLLGDGFQIVCGKQESFPAKPDPALTLKVIEGLGVAPSECLFVGDSGMDMKVAKNAGCVGVGVLWGFREEDELTQNGADYIINNPNLILKVIKNEE